MLFHEYLPKVAQSRMLAAAAALSHASASYQLPHGALPVATRHRAPSPTLGFFEDMKRGFDAGMEGTKAPEGTKKEAANAPEGAKAPAEPSFFDTLRKTLINAAPTAEERLEERKRRGEGVVWSADFSRVWMSTKGTPPCGNASPIWPAGAGQSRPEPARAAQAKPLSAPDHASGCTRLRPASDHSAIVSHLRGEGRPEAWAHSPTSWRARGLTWAY